MTERIQDVDQKIECLRAELNALVLRMGFDLHHPKVLELSSSIDELVTQWHHLDMERKTPRC